MSDQIVAVEEKKKAKYGFKYLRGFKKWFEHGVSNEQVDCGAYFAFGVSVCAKGPVVNVMCDIDGESMKGSLAVGCGCNGVYARGKVMGVMPGAQGAACSGMMQSWTRNVERKFMRPEQTETCVAKAMRACRAHQVEVDEQNKMKKDAQMMQQKTKMFNLDNVVRTISKANDQAEAEKVKLMKELANPVFVYTKIPGFGVPKLNMEKVDSIVKCEDKCNTNVRCKSFSYDNVQGSCSWAGHALDYNDDFVLYVKQSGPGLGSFSTIPGMKFSPNEEPGDTTERVGSSAECKFDCLQSDKCTAMSYSQTSKRCLISQVPVQLGSDWDYYEKKRLHVNEVNPSEEKRKDAELSEKRKIWKKEVEIMAVGTKNEAKQQTGGAI